MKSKIKSFGLMLIVSLILTICPNVSATEEILYEQNFGTESGIIPLGWSIPDDSKYISIKEYEDSLESKPDKITGCALNACASGYGDRSAYIDIDSTNVFEKSLDSCVFEFDLYMDDGVNTCNIFSLGNNQNNSYSDLSNTFFAIGNGDGIGARKTLRYYNYDTQSWVSIDNANAKWLNIKVMTDFANEKVAFDIKTIDNENIGTFGPFSFSNEFEGRSPMLSRIVMSAFRTNGGNISLNTWMDNFKVYPMTEEQRILLNYQGILPKGTLGYDYNLIESNGDTVISLNNEVAIDSMLVEKNQLAIINADIMIPELPDDGYQVIYSFNSDVNGNVLVDADGNLVNQYSESYYKDMIGNTRTIKENKWYNIKGYIFSTTDSSAAHYTFTISGDFGNGYEEIDYVSETRNSDKLSKLNIIFGGRRNSDSVKENILINNISVKLENKPNVTIQYDSSKLDVVNNGNNIESNNVIYNSVPLFLNIRPVLNYDVTNVLINGEDVTDELRIDMIWGGYWYTLPLKNEDIIINLEVNVGEPEIITTKEDEPYPLNPSDPWDLRKYASETRTIQIKNTKMAYRLYKPQNYSIDSEEKYPLVVSLRAKGPGNTGFDNKPYTAGHVEDVLTSEQYANDYPCFVLSPQCYDATWEDNNYTNIAMVIKIVDELVNEFSNIDTNRIYIGGLSDGGMASWIATAIKPDLFAASFSMSGRAIDESYAEYCSNTPMWTFYAVDDSDQGVPRTNIAMINAIRALGGEAISTTYNGGHIITWKEGLQSPLFKWLFSKEKNDDGTDNDILQQIEDYNKSINTELNLNVLLNMPISNSEAQKQETELGDIVTDAIKMYTSADISLINGSDLGSGLPSGSVSENDILAAVPIQQRVGVAEISGIELKELLTNALTYYPEIDNRFLQMSGLEISFDPDVRPSQRIKSILVNGTELDPNKYYKVALTEHLISNKLNNTYEKELKITTMYYQTVSQMLVNYLNEYYDDDFTVTQNRINII